MKKRLLKLIRLLQQIRVNCSSVGRKISTKRRRCFGKKALCNIQRNVCSSQRRLKGTIGLDMRVTTSGRNTFLHKHLGPAVLLQFSQISFTDLGTIIRQRASFVLGSPLFFNLIRQGRLSR